MPARPCEINVRRTPFDHFAERASEVVGRAGFFIASMTAVLVWIPTILVCSSVYRSIAELRATVGLKERI